MIAIGIVGFVISGISIVCWAKTEIWTLDEDDPEIITGMNDNATVLDYVLFAGGIFGFFLGAFLNFLGYWVRKHVIVLIEERKDQVIELEANNTNAIYNFW